MTTSELREFKRQITPNATQTLVAALKNAKTTTKMLSRETSPHTNQLITEISPSREIGPHPNKSIKRLAQALKKRAKHEAEQQTCTPKLDQSSKALAEALKTSTQASHPDPSAKKLADALERYAKRKSKRPTRTYAERIRELIGSPEQCKECGGEHPTRLCMKQFEKLRKPETTPLPVTDDNSSNSDT